MIRDEILWTAGFLEGEGSFALGGARRASARIDATQIQRAPLERLQRGFGGSIRQARRPTTGGHNYHVWNLGGVQAAGLMMALYSQMSPVRKQQIVKVLSRWRLAPVYARFRQRCPRGHVYDRRTTDRRQNGARECGKCRRWFDRKRREREAAASGRRYVPRPSRRKD